MPAREILPSRFSGMNVSTLNGFPRTVKDENSSALAQLFKTSFPAMPPSKMSVCGKGAFFPISESDCDRKFCHSEHTPSRDGEIFFSKFSLRSLEELVLKNERASFRSTFKREASRRTIRFPPQVKFFTTSRMPSRTR